jgi:hypothetical protein
MRKIISFLCLLLLIIFRLSAQEDVSASQWQGKPVVIDGNDDEWNKPFHFFDNSSGLIFTMTNDSKNLYLCFSNNDRAKTGKMMAAGWSLQMVSSEKKRKFDATISFPKSADIAMRADFTSVVSMYKATIQTVKTKGFVSANGDLPINSKDGLAIGIGTDSTEKIVYEIKIPIKELMEEAKVQLNETITLDITINAMDKPSGQISGATEGRSRVSGGSRGGGRMGGGRGGRPMVGSSGFDRGNSGTSDRYALFDKATIKQKIKLVAK